MCEYCKTPGKTIDVIEIDAIEAEGQIFVNLAGAYIQIFDEEYPGFIHNIPIRFCPMCGKKLREGAADSGNSVEISGSETADRGLDHSEYAGT